jgi:hypothetical protein
MSDTLLILHVKGTEAETKTLPRHAVQAALSQGEITNSQLIWSTEENSWKQASEYPGIVPLENLILHVKGTESETRQLPKPAVRNALSQGEITHSQLIWSPVDNTWKQAREFPDLLPGEHLILHVKGTEAETKELPKRAVRTAISQGEITHSQLIWSPAQNSWKQVRELPDLLPSQKLAPAPKRAAVVAQPKVAEAMVPDSPGGPVARAAQAAGASIPRARVAKVAGGTVPRVRVAVEAPPKVSVISAGATPQVRVAATPVASPQDVASIPTAAEMPKIVRAAATTPARAAAIPVAKPVVQQPAVASASSRPAASYKVQQEDHAHPLKWVCIVLGGLILLLVGANYFLVDRPLASRMSQTDYPNIAYAHFGAFMQPGVMVIHIPVSSKITADNLPEFLVTLAHNTPPNPLTNDLFSRVALTSGWTAQYSFSGFTWNEIGSMGGESKDRLKDEILMRLSDAGGQPLAPETTMNTDMQKATREQIWDKFVANFTSH